MFLRLLLVALFAFAAAGAPKPPLRILFVGNSLTYNNDLPAMVARIGALDERRIETETIAFPNHALEDHLRDGRVQRMLLASRWDFVVLQQGPSSLMESRRQLIRDVKQFDVLRRDAKLAVLMVWPPRERQRVWGDVAEAHRLAAEAVHGTLIPAGAALRSALERDARLQLLGADGFHPTVAGTYLVALSTYRALAGPLPPGLDTPAGARKVAGAKVKDAPLLFEIATQ